MPSPLDALAAKAMGESYDDDDEPSGDAYDASREEGVALMKKLFKAYESRDAEKGYDTFCKIVALKSGGKHKA